MSLPLSNGTLERIEILFSEPEKTEVIQTLIEECGTNLPFCDKLTVEGSERFRFAVLKLSNGDILEFRRAIKIVKEDWRDTLVAAGFGHSVTIHQEWWPNKNSTT